MGFEGFRPSRAEKSELGTLDIAEIERIAHELKDRNEAVYPEGDFFVDVPGEALPEDAASELRRIVEEVRKTD